MIGKSIAHFEITATLGEGGMGEVYRATDTKLSREVALKVLPESFAQDPQRMARFQREAQVLASLNHPNIAAIHGLEDADGQKALVMELVEGEDLSERIARGPIPLDEALPIALQIAEALEDAHEKGIIHRDLKPANIKLTSEGKVKVLDFGLAKALEEERTQEEISNSPTLTMQATQAGIILGTAAYMSPEQARGQLVDRRTDIWAFGATVYEMLTGRQIFAGKTASDVLARVLEREPDWDELPSTVAAQLRELLQRTLRKDRDRRLQSIGDARIALLEAQESPVPDSPPAVGPRVGWIGTATVLLSVAAAAGLVGFWLRSTSLPTKDHALESGPILSEISVPAETPIAFGITHAFDPVLIALSPDGSNLVLVGRRSDGRSQLFLRKLGGIEVTPIPGTEDAIHPFFSPDGQWVGFLTQDRVRKVSLQGGGVTTLCQAATSTRATWAENGMIYFAQNEGRILWAVPENGGEARKITDLDSLAAALSQVLPDGRAAIVSAETGGINQDFGTIYILPLDTLKPRVLIEGGYDGRYVSSGHLLFARTGTLMAVPFDPGEMRVEGNPVPVLSGVRTESLFGNVQLAVSNGGTVVYSPGGDAAVGRIARVERDGNFEMLPMPERVYGVLDLSPDGNELAIHVGDVNDFVWIYDISRQEGRRLVISGHSGWPRWSPDGQMIASVADQQAIDIRSVIGQATAHRTIGGEGNFVGISAGDWTPDGSVLSFSQDRGRKIGFLSTQLEHQVRWLTLADDVVYWGPTFSPDGKWVAYASDETGQLEIWIRSYPDLESAFQVSTAGGMEPVWVKSGELFYHAGNRWMATRVTATESSPKWDPPELVFETEYMDTPGVSYDVSADGQYLFLVKSAVPPVSTQIYVVHNWFDELKRLVPTE